MIQVLFKVLFYIFSDYTKNNKISSYNVIEKYNLFRSLLNSIFSDCTQNDPFSAINEIRNKLNASYILISQAFNEFQCDYSNLLQIQIQPIIAPIPQTAYDILPKPPESQKDINNNNGYDKIKEGVLKELKIIKPFGKTQQCSVCNRCYDLNYMFFTVDSRKFICYFCSFNSNRKNLKDWEYLKSSDRNSVKCHRCCVYKSKSRCRENGCCTYCKLIYKRNYLQRKQK